MSQRVRNMIATVMRTLPVGDRTPAVERALRSAPREELKALAAAAEQRLTESGGAPVVNLGLARRGRPLVDEDELLELPGYEEMAANNERTSSAATVDPEDLEDEDDDDPVTSAHRRQADAPLVVNEDEVLELPGYDGPVVNTHHDRGEDDLPPRRHRRDERPTTNSRNEATGGALGAALDDLLFYAPFGCGD